VSRPLVEARRRGAAAAATPAAEPARVPLQRELPKPALERPLDFDAVYTAHVQHVLRWARALGGMQADVDDLTQEVFLVVRRKLDSFSGPSLPAWLYGITRKTVSDYRRRAFMRRLLGGVNRSLELAPEASAIGSASDPFERAEAQRILRVVLERMSAVRRTAFILFEIQGYTGEEIAELEQIPLATVYTRLHHARKDFLKLTAEITGDPPEEPPR
jgi:RNA polymerase sigma-70 factor (ECF subfamily)